MPHMIVVFGIFLIFLFCFLEGIKWQKWTHNYQFQSVTLNVLKTVDHIIKIFGTHV